MAHPSAHRPPADIIQQRSQQQQHQINYLRQKNAQLSSGSPSSIAAAAAASSKGPSAPRSNAELVRPHYRGHQRRQSVARLLPDISKLRLLSWLVEASNELINCDIAIMDGVYAKLNRSRESLLFWQQSQQQQQASVGGGISSRAPPPALPPVPPSVQPVANKTVISKRQKHQLKKNSTTSLLASNSSQQLGLVAGNKSLHQKNSSSATVDGISTTTRNAISRNHHSLPLTNYDSSSLAAISMKSSLSTSTNKTTNDNDSIIGSVHSQPATIKSASDSIAASMMAMMQQNTHHQQQQRQQQRQQFALRGQPMGARNNCSLPIQLSGTGPSASASSGGGHTPLTVGSVSEQADYCDDSNQSDDDDDDDNSSAASSTTSSGIHGASSEASSTSSSASSSVDSSCSIDGLSASATIASSVRGAPQPPSSRNQSATGSGEQPTTAASSAEQLSERIRRAVMEHNYLQNLLVNVIRQHDRQRERHEQEIAALRQPTSLDAYDRRSGASSNVDELPRIDLAGIAESLDDGCQCSCHYTRIRYDGSLSSTPPPRPPPPSLRDSNKTFGNTKSSTLPTNSSLSLFQPTSLVPSRKNRRKKHSEPSREDLIQKLSDKLCENCFETHYWLHSCVSIESPAEIQQQQQQQEIAVGQTTTETNDLRSGNNSAPTDSHDHRSRATNGPLGGSSSSSSSKTTAPNNSNLDSIVSLRNATFIRLVQQQVRATISDSIELIDLIRREIKSPESIKQKQLMRCFSASIQLLSSVANYVVPSQDISTFIPTEMVSGGGQGNRFGGINANSSGQQQTATTLFNLPPSDFDHILLYPHHHSTAGLSESFLSSHHHGYQGAHQLNQQQANNYHLAQAPEIPIRRRNLQQQQRPAQRRSFDESCTQDRLQQHPRVHLLSRPGRPVGGGSGGGGSFRSLPPDVNNRSSLNVDRQLDILSEKSFDETTKELKNDSLLNLRIAPDGITDEIAVTNTNPDGNVDSSSGASSNNSSASSSIARGQVQQSSLKAQVTTASATSDEKITSHDLTMYGSNSSQRNQLHQSNHHRSSAMHDNDDLVLFQSCRSKFWQSSKFNFIKKLLQVKQQRLLRQQSKDRRIYNNKVANKFRLVMMDLIHFNKSQQLLTTENGVNSLLTSMRNVLEFGLYLTVKLY